MPSKSQIMNNSIVSALCLFAQVISVASHRVGGLGGPGRDVPQQPLMGSDFIDVSTDSEFFGLGTFANLPYVNCLSTENSNGGRYDIAILGAPFDTVSSYLENRGGG